MVKWKRWKIDEGEKCCRLQVAGFRLQVAGFRLQVAGFPAARD